MANSEVIQRKLWGVGFTILPAKLRLWLLIYIDFHIYSFELHEGKASIYFVHGLTST